jgi:hypothetical protein
MIKRNRLLLKSAIPITTNRFEKLTHLHVEYILLKLAPGLHSIDLSYPQVIQIFSFGNKFVS